MISYQRTKLWQKPWVISLTVAAVVVIAAMWPTDGDNEGAAAQSTSAPTTGTSTDPMTPGIGPQGHELPPNDEGRPVDFTAQEWSTLTAAAAESEHPHAELARLVGYLRFQKGFAQWQGLQNSPDTAQRRRLAEQLLTQLPDRLSQGEVGAGEAMLLQEALMRDAVPDATQRQQQLVAAQAELAKAAPPEDVDQQKREDALRAEYKRREAAIMADHRSRGEGQRNAAQLESELEAARRAVYGQAK